LRFKIQNSEDRTKDSSEWRVKDSGTTKKIRGINKIWRERPSKRLEIKKKELKQQIYKFQDIE